MVIAAREEAGAVNEAIGAIVCVCNDGSPTRKYVGGVVRSPFNNPRKPTVSPRCSAASALMSRASAPVATVTEAFSSM